MLEEGRWKRMNPVKFKPEIPHEGLLAKVALRSKGSVGQSRYLFPRRRGCGHNTGIRGGFKFQVCGWFI